MQMFGLILIAGDRFEKLFSLLSEDYHIAMQSRIRSQPGPVHINFAGRGPGLGLTFPGLGRARAYSESHYYFKIMVKDYLHLSIAKDHCFLCCKCNCTMQCISMATRQACQPIYYPFNTQQWSSTAELQDST